MNILETVRNAVNEFGDDAHTRFILNGGTIDNNAFCMG